MKKSSYHYKFIMMLLPLWLGMPSESMAVEGAKDAAAGVGKGGGRYGSEARSCIVRSQVAGLSWAGHGVER